MNDSLQLATFDQLMVQVQRYSHYERESQVPLSVYKELGTCAVIADVDTRRQIFLLLEQDSLNKGESFPASYPLPPHFLQNMKGAPRSEQLILTAIAYAHRLMTVEILRTVWPDISECEDRAILGLASRCISKLRPRITEVGVFVNTPRQGYSFYFHPLVLVDIGIRIATVSKSDHLRIAELISRPTEGVHDRFLPAEVLPSREVEDFISTRSLLLEPQEFRLLALFMGSANKEIAPWILERYLWDNAINGSCHSDSIAVGGKASGRLKALISDLRSRLRSCKNAGIIPSARRGFGYTWIPPEGWNGMGSG